MKFSNKIFPKFIENFNEKKQEAFDGLQPKKYNR